VLYQFQSLYLYVTAVFFSIFFSERTHERAELCLKAYAVGARRAATTSARIRRARAGGPSRLSRRMRGLNFIIAAVAGLLGAMGVGAAAAGAHLGGGQLLETAATFLMIHSAAVLGITALAQHASRRGAALFIIAALALIVGMLLFCGDFAMRGLADRPLFRMAAPSGGMLLMAGWVAAAIAAAMAAVSRARPPAG
jgi:uncharacterized membrane protein YgdD (TMEM256/DUF423 family)